MEIKAPRGAGDILPDETEKWQKIEEVAREVLSLYNYREVRTPIFEDTSLFERSIGRDTDIVEKEMYTFRDKKGRSLTLRPEGTAPVTRAYLEHNLNARGGLTKLFYIGPFFRYERPQAGRSRQFYQIGAEAIGSANPALDAELIGLSLQFFRSLGLKDLRVSLNSIGCFRCQPLYREKLKQFLETHLEELCNDCKRRVVKNVLRVLDCKNETCTAIIKLAPLSARHLCSSCKMHFEAVRRFLDLLNVEYSISSHLVRGIDYYTRTTFEIVHLCLGAQNAIAGGGRFDGLVEEFGGSATPAVGFAAGVERIAMVIDRQKIELQPTRRPSVFIAVTGKELFEKALILLNKVHSAGVSAEVDYEDRSLKSQFRYADKLGVKFTVIVGQEGLTLKDMRGGEQKQLSEHEILNTLKE